MGWFSCKEEAFFLSYLIDQYKYFEREGKLREDGSFYTSNMDIAWCTTVNNSQRASVKKAVWLSYGAGVHVLHEFTAGRAFAVPSGGISRGHGGEFQ